MRLFDGLYLYEVVLLVLGTILFLVMLIQLVKQHNYKAALPLFVLAALMIGYPSIKSVEYSDGKLKVDKYLRTVEENPDDLQARAGLQDAVKTVADRPSRTADTALMIAKAQYALGQEGAAENSLAKASELNPSDPKVKDFREKVEMVKRIDRLNMAVQSNPQDQSLKTQLAEQVATVTREPISNPVALTKVASAQVSLGNRDAALKNVDKAVRIDPKLSEAQRLRTQIQR